MVKTVRMSDIAERLGVSTVTVSKALAGKDGVSEPIRQKIKALADEMGYRHRASAVKGAGGTGNIGILIPSGYVEKTNSFYWDMYERVVKRLAVSGYFGILEMVGLEEEQELAEPRVLRDGKTDGLILIGQASNTYLEMLRRKNVPVMYLDFYGSAGGGSCVISDGFYGMYSVTNYLIAMGHRDIRFVGSVHATSSICDRYFGYCRAMMEHGLEFGEDRVIPDRGEDGTLRICLPEVLPTAFVCNCDLVAGVVTNRLKDRGLQVPEDISVAGFDDYIFPGISTAEFTTYAVDMDGMARACVDRLLRKLNNPHYEPNLKIVSGRLVVRGSVKTIKVLPEDSETN